MSSSDFKTIHIIDDRLKDVKEINYAVRSGGSNVSTVVYIAQSHSVNSMSFAIQCPSQNVVVDRRVLWTSTVVLKMVGIPQDGEKLIQNGYSGALAPFPLHSLCQTQQCQINSNTISVNTRDVLYPLLKLHDRKSITDYNSMTPIMLDGAYQRYSDGYLTATAYNVGLTTPSVNNPLADYLFTTDPSYPPRGAFYIDAVGSVYDANTNTVSAEQVVGNGVDTRTSYISFTVSEPLIALSPFTFNSSCQGGLYGISNLTFTFNLDSSTNCRAYRDSGITNVLGSALSCQVMAYSNPSLTLNYITPQSTIPRNPKCILPYYEVPRYIQPCPAIASGTSQTVTMSNIQLNSIPDSLIIFARKPIASQTCKDSDFFLCPRSINLNFNNNSGLLSGVPARTLYNMTKKNGLDVPWGQFWGRQNQYSPATDEWGDVPTGGSPLVLNFGTDLELGTSGLASGSIGNFNLQFNIELYNQTADEISPELVLITVNSGIFTTYNGQSSIFTAILNRSDVLDTMQTAPIGQQDVRRLVGSGFMDNLRALGSDVWRGIKTAAPFLAPIGKQLLKQSGNKYASTGADVLGALGYGGDSGGRKGALRRYSKM